MKIVNVYVRSLFQNKCKLSNIFRINGQGLLLENVCTIILYMTMQYILLGTSARIFLICSIPMYINFVKVTQNVATYTT